MELIVGVDIAVPACRVHGMKCVPWVIYSDGNGTWEKRMCMENTIHHREGNTQYFSFED